MQCLVVLDLFQQNSGIFALPVVNSDNIPVGLVDRKGFIKSFIKPFSKKLNGKKKISDFMNSSSIIVDHNSTIDDVARIIIDAGMQHMVSGFISTENGHYIGVVNGLDLLNEVTQRKPDGKHSFDGTVRSLEQELTESTATATVTAANPMIALTPG